MLYFPFCGMFHKLHYGDNNFLVNNTKGLSIDGFFLQFKLQNNPKKFSEEDEA